MKIGKGKRTNDPTHGRPDIASAVAPFTDALRTKPASCVATGKLQSRGDGVSPRLWLLNELAIAAISARRRIEAGPRAEDGRAPEERSTARAGERAGIPGRDGGGKIRVLPGHMPDHMHDRVRDRTGQIHVREIRRRVAGETDLAHGR